MVEWYRWRLQEVVHMSESAITICLLFTFTRPKLKPTPSWTLVTKAVKVFTSTTSCDVVRGHQRVQGTRRGHSWRSDSNVPVVKFYKNTTTTNCRDVRTGCGSVKTRYNLDGTFGFYSETQRFINTYQYCILIHSAKSEKIFF